MARRMGQGGIVVHIGTEYTDRDLKRAQADLRRLSGTAKTSQGTMSKFGSTMQNAVGRNLFSVQTAIAGAVAGMGAFAVSMAVDGVKAAMAEEQQLARLKSALDNVNQGFALENITTAIDKMMYATGVADDELRPAFQTLVTATRDAERSQQLLALAVDISIAKQKDLGSVATALAKASTGQASALTRLGVPLSENARKAGNFQIAVQELSAAFGGAAAANADTFAGKLKILQIAFDETKEAFGTGFLEGFQASLDALGQVGDGIVGLQTDVQSLGVSVGEVAGQVVTLAAQFANLKTELGPFGFLLNPFNALQNDMTLVRAAVEAVKGVFGDIIPVVDTASQAMQTFAFTDFSYLFRNLDTTIQKANDAARPRTLLLTIAEFKLTPGMGAGAPSLNALLADYYAGLQEDANDAADATNSAGDQAAPKVNPFREWTKRLADEGAKLAARTRLIAKGIPAVMVDGILTDPGWKKITQGVMAAGADAVKKYVRQWTMAPEGVEAIGARVDAIVQAAQNRLKTLRDAEKNFRNIQQGFSEIATDFGKIGQIDQGVPVTATTITDDLRQRLASVRQFAAAVRQLQEQGLGPAALVDVIRLGPFEGLQYANAILEGGQFTIDQISQITAQFQTPADIIGRVGAEAQTGTTLEALQARETFTLQAGAVQITVNGEVTAQTRAQITDAVTDAFRQVGREARTRGRTGVR